METVPKSEEQSVRIMLLSTVHPRNDTRVALKECTDLTKRWPGQVALMVADGLGSGTENGRRIIDIGQPPGRYLGRALVGGARAVRFILRPKPEVVHFHDPELIIPAFILKLSGIKVIYDVHEWVPGQIRQKAWVPKWLREPLAGVFRGLQFIANRWFDAIVVATPTIGSHFSGPKITLVQNFPRLDELRGGSDSRYRERSNAFAYVGAIARHRGAVEMVNAIGKLDAKYEPKLHLAGAFRPSQLETEARSLPGWQCIKFHGWVDREQLATLLSNVRGALVLFHPAPNHTEAQPNKLFEYMSAGVPVIASDFPLWRELISQAGCGLLVDPQDEDAIAGAMTWILDNEEEAMMMGKKGQQAVKERFNWDPESRKLIQLYEKLLGESG